MSDQRAINEAEASKVHGAHIDTSALPLPDMTGINPQAPGHSNDPAVAQEAGFKHPGPDPEQAPVTHEGIERSAGKSVATGDARQTTGETNRSSGN